MKAYTTNELFELLGSASCHRDVIEVNYYILGNFDHYTTNDLIKLLCSINILHNVFIKAF